MTVPKKEQNAGVALLLERMKTNPEEFISENGYAYSKWGSLISAYKQHLEAEDQEALTNALDSLLQQRFTEKVLEELVDPKESNLKELLKAKLNATPSGGTTLGQSWVNTQLQQAQQIQNNQLHELLHAKALAELETHKAKQVQRTLVGRLKNYLHNE